MRQCISMSWSEPPAPASALSLFLSNFHAPYYYAYNKFLALFFYPSCCLSTSPPNPLLTLTSYTHIARTHTSHTHTHTHTNTHTHTQTHTHTHTHTRQRRQNERGAATLPPQWSHSSVARLRLTFYVAVFCSVLQCVTEILKTPTLPPQRSHPSVACLRLTFFVAVCCSVLQNFSKRQYYLLNEATHVSHVPGLHCVLQCVAVCCRISQNAITTTSAKLRGLHVSGWRYVLQCVKECFRNSQNTNNTTNSAKWQNCHMSQVEIECCRLCCSTLQKLKSQFATQGTI